MGLNVIFFVAKSFYCYYAVYFLECTSLFVNPYSKSLKPVDIK